MAMCRGHSTQEGEAQVNSYEVVLVDDRELPAKVAWVVACSAEGKSAFVKRDASPEAVKAAAEACEVPPQR